MDFLFCGFFLFFIFYTSRVDQLLFFFPFVLNNGNDNQILKQIFSDQV